MGGGTCRNIVELYGRRYNNAPMSSLPLLGSGLGASEPVTRGGCQRVAVVAASVRLVGGFCRNVVEISGRIFVAVPFLPVVLTLAAWSGVGALQVMSALEKKSRQHMGRLPLRDLQRIWVELE